MSHQSTAAATRASANGYVHRRIDRDCGGRFESKVHVSKGSSSAASSRGLANGGKQGGHSSPSRDRLVYVMTHCIGQHVEVHVKNGSVIFGIFHATNVEKDFGIVLKMAQVIRDGSSGWQNPVTDVVKKPQTMIIPARDLVQLVVKDVALTIDGLTSGQSQEKSKDLMIDSAISHSRHTEQRELERWAPDEDDSDCVELEGIYDRKWNRSWDQFETNKALFGVKSTFNEEIYTTKLIKGPHMRELEEQATRIAKEIEGEQTNDLHLAEERNIYVGEDMYHDEELKYSAVRRNLDTNKYVVKEKLPISVPNLETSLDSLNGDACNDATDSSANPLDKEVSACNVEEKSSNKIGPTDHYAQPSSIRIQNKSSNLGATKMCDEKMIEVKDDETSLSSLDVGQCSEEGNPIVSQDTVGLLLSPMQHDLCSSSLGKKHSDLSSNSTLLGKVSSSAESGNLRPGSSSSISEQPGTTTVSAGISLSPSSSAGSLASEKSSLNPNAKEFKLNPNARSFTPSTSLRPQTPVSDGSFYYPVIPNVPGVPMAMAITPPFGGQQPLIYNPHSPHVQSPQGYMQPGGPMYGQQMMVAQPRPVYYMQQCTPEMQYRGRNF